MIVRALANAGVRGTVVFPSKFDWLFGTAAPRSGTFQGAIDGTQVWADVHFLDRTLEGITACVLLSQTRETAFTVSVKGRPQVLGNGNATGYLGSSGPMYFAGNDRLFVMTPDVRVRDALRSSLALSVPSCIWREPATLPALGWEPEVMDALQRGGTALLAERAQTSSVEMGTSVGFPRASRTRSGQVSDSTASASSTAAMGWVRKVT